MLFYQDEASQDESLTHIGVLIRHAERPAFINHQPRDVDITPAGVLACQQLGKYIRHRVVSVSSSVVKRCIQTGESIMQGADCLLPITISPLLGAPNVFISDKKMADVHAKRLGHHGTMEHMLWGREPLPGFAEPVAAGHQLLELMLATIAQRPGVHLFVTHDTVLATFVARMRVQAREQFQWPDFLGHCYVVPKTPQQCLLQYEQCQQVINRHHF